MEEAAKRYINLLLNESLPATMVQNSMLFAQNEPTKSPIPHKNKAFSKITAFVEKFKEWVGNIDASTHDAKL